MEFIRYYGSVFLAVIFYCFFDSLATNIVFIKLGCQSVYLFPLAFTKSFILGMEKLVRRRNLDHAVQFRLPHIQQENAVSRNITAQNYRFFRSTALAVKFGLIRKLGMIYVKYPAGIVAHCSLIGKFYDPFGRFITAETKIIRYILKIGQSKNSQTDYKYQQGPAYKISESIHIKNYTEIRAGLTLSFSTE